MKEFLSTIQLALTATNDWLTGFWGGYDGLLHTLMIFVVINLIVSIMCSIVDKDLFSALNIRNIFKKVLIFALVGIGHILDNYVISASPILRTGIIFFYLFKEGTYLVENVEHIGLQIPAILKKFFDQLHKHTK